MKSLASDKISDQLLRTLWLQRLPIQMQQILSACKDELSDLASISDKVHEVSGFSEANAVSLPPTDSVAELRKEVQQLREEVQRLALSRTEMPYPKKPRSRSVYRVRVHRLSGRSLGIVGITCVLVIALASVLPLVIFRETEAIISNDGYG
ncbi:hypothetical protein AVEN_173162-1 [Araneus ventricosus]|uniref:Uncharacterized protein n=1 Tax=Araneus ventricosus TaxID=182803 RepID=A0A4Y2EMC2_ARAVE|nr:hypothetical protein AVEN_173162-1 [Araneus ventricosus]